MHTENLQPWMHSHTFALVDQRKERRTLIVVVVTAVMMVAEVLAGYVFGSMALLADGWHMATHVLALGIAVFAYRYARGHATDPRFTFGTGKVGVLGGFASAIVLAMVALLMVGESVVRFYTQAAIRLDEAIIVAIIGLVVNVVCAVVLGMEGPRQHDHDHDHDHAHGHNHPHAAHGHDHNFRAAYLHVLADAVTSVLAIIALVAAKIWGWLWLDPLMGIVGGVLIARWAYGLLRETGRILLDAVADAALLKAIRAAIEARSTDRVADVHVWRVGPQTCAAIVSLVTDNPQAPERYKDMLSHIEGLAHVTIEVQPCH
jgi:cation diffusion facilitator family transporter